MLPPDDDDHSATAAKPLPDLPSHAPPAVDHFEPYRDDPESPEHAPVPASPALQPCRAISAPQPQPQSHAQPQFPFVPYTDAEPDDSDDVPLAHLYPYPTEPPPSYYVAVRGPYRDTLIQHIPPTFLGHRDEEAGAPRAHVSRPSRSNSRSAAASRGVTSG